MKSGKVPPSNQEYYQCTVGKNSGANINPTKGSLNWTVCPVLLIWWRGCWEPTCQTCACIPSHSHSLFFPPSSPLSFSLHVLQIEIKVFGNMKETYLRHLSWKSNQSTLYKKEIPPFSDCLAINVECSWSWFLMGFTCPMWGAHITQRRVVSVSTPQNHLSPFRKVFRISG